MSYYTPSANGTALLQIYVQPKASKTKLVGLFDGCLKLAIAAPPVDGKANEEVVKFLARMLSIPARDIVIQAGAQSRRKRLLIRAAELSEVKEKIEKMLSDCR